MSEFSHGIVDGSGIDGSMMDGSGADAGALGGPSHTAAWNPGIKGVKFSDMLQGINITPNFMLAMLFLAFTGWLFVIYWIRHNEPLANQVLGTPTGGSPLALEDRALVDRAKHALPIRTSSKMGNFYTPDRDARLKHEQEMAAKRQQESAYRASLAMPNIVQHGTNELHFSAPGASHARMLWNNRESVVVPQPEPVVMAPTVHNNDLRGFSSASPMAHPAAQPTATGIPYGSGFYSAGAGSHYHMPVQSVDGTRLKTVVNR